MDLFICNFGMHRSRTAAELFNGVYAGIKSENNPVTKELLQEADIIYVMEPVQEEFLRRNFVKEIVGKVIKCLNVYNFYGYMHPSLVKELKEKMGKV